MHAPPTQPAGAPAAPTKYSWGAVPGVVSVDKAARRERLVEEIRLARARLLSLEEELRHLDET